MCLGRQVIEFHFWCVLLFILWSSGRSCPSCRWVGGYWSSGRRCYSTCWSWLAVEEMRKWRMFLSTSKYRHFIFMVCFWVLQKKISRLFQVLSRLLLLFSRTMGIVVLLCEDELVLLDGRASIITHQIALSTVHSLEQLVLCAIPNLFEVRISSRREGVQAQSRWEEDIKLSI